MVCRMPTSVKSMRNRLLCASVAVDTWPSPDLFSAYARDILRCGGAALPFLGLDLNINISSL